MVTHDSGLTLIMGSTSWLLLPPPPRMGIHFVHKHLEGSMGFCSNLYTFNSYLPILEWKVPWPSYRGSYQHGGSQVHAKSNGAIGIS